MDASSPSQREIELEGVGSSSRQDDPITRVGVHENAAGDPEAGDTRMDPILYRYATKKEITFSVVSPPGFPFSASRRTLDQVKSLVEKGITFIRAMSATGRFPSMCSIADGKIPDQVESLVKSSENKVSPRGNTVLHLAASTGHVQLIKLVVQHIPGLVCKRNEDGELPLHVAASSGHLSAVTCLVLGTLQGNTLNEEDKRGNTALHVALENNHQEVAKFLVGKDALTSHSPNKSGKTPLCMAAETANLELVKTMLASTPDKTMLASTPDSPTFWESSNGNSILRAAIIWRKNAIHELLVKRTPIVLPEFPVQLFVFQLFVGLKIIYYYLFGIVKVTDRMIFRLFQRWTAKTNRKNYTDVLETILSKIDPAQISSTGKDWMTPLTLAAYIGNFVAVQVLLQKFTGLAYERDENHFLPIHVASKKGHYRVVQEFLRHCPDLRESRDKEWRNILHVAAKHGKVKMVRYIIRRRDLQALINERDKNGNTPLHIAVQNWHPCIVDILSSHVGANLNSLNDADMTALDVGEKEEVEIEMLFRRKLTLMALTLANARRSEVRTATNAKLVMEDSDLKTKGTKNLFFSKDSINTLLVVSTLVATITFAAGFTVPGGYKSSGNGEGTPTFLTHWLFQIFLICNTMAMSGSITLSIALMWAQTGDPKIIHAAMRFTLPVLGATLTLMSFAFLAGVALIAYTLFWLRIVVMVMGLLFTSFILMLVLPLFDSPLYYEIPATRNLLYFSFNLLIWVSGYDSDVDDMHYRWYL